MSACLGCYVEPRLGPINITGSSWIRAAWWCYGKFPGQIALFVIKHHGSTRSSWDCWDHHWDHSHDRQLGWSGQQANVSQHWNVGHTQHDDGMTWKHFLYYWTFRRGIHWLPGTRYELSQWETTLHCNTISHWLSPYAEWSLVKEFLWEFLWWMYNQILKWVPVYLFRWDKIFILKLGWWGFSWLQFWSQRSLDRFSCLTSNSLCIDDSLW